MNRMIKKKKSNSDALSWVCVQEDDRDTHYYQHLKRVPFKIFHKIYIHIYTVEPR